MEIYTANAFDIQDRNSAQVESERFWLGDFSGEIFLLQGSFSLDWFTGERKGIGCYD